MDVRALRYFVETVRLASFTQAANSLFVTQSTVSKMIRQLETELGTPLLIRQGHRALPTDTGRIVYERGRQILASMRALDGEVREAADLQRGRLEVGIPPMINLLFAPVVKAFRSRWPSLQLSLREASGQAVERLVSAGDLELGATILPVDPQGPLEARRFGSFPILAVSQPDAPWAGRPTLTLAALRDQPLLLPAEDFALTRRLRQAFTDAGITPHVAAQSAHWDFLVSMASAGLGVALLPEPLLRRMKTRGLATARLVRPALHWEVGHIWMRDRYLSYAARAWLAICDEVLVATPAAKNSRVNP